MGPKENDIVGKRYTITEELGQDDFGLQFFAQDSETDEIVQLKTLPPQMHADEEAKARFLREFELLSSLRHPGIVSVLASGEDAGLYYFVTEHEEGITLDNYIEVQGTVIEKDAVSLILPVIESLKYLWESENIVHRDIKPKKIFITDDNKVKLCDLGLAKSTSNDTMELTGVGMAMGTPDYISPEQASGEELDFRTDMYSLGLVLYEMVTGEKAFSGPIMEVINKQLSEMPPQASTFNGVSDRCSDIIDKMIQKSPDERFESWVLCIDAMKLLLDSTIMESDLQRFDIADLEGGYSEKINASGIILEEEEPDNDSSAGRYGGPRGVDVIEAGSIIGNGYEIDRKIGVGSMGDIYLAFSEEVNKLVQVKILPADMTDDQEKVERFLQEIKLTASLSHPNLLSVIEAGEDNGRYYLVTEYEEGISYHDYIGRYGPLHEKDALNFLIQIVEVLKYAWKEKKLLHREIKPENILIREDSKDAKLTDFGVAKTLEGEALNLTGMGFTIGTPDYMSPEQVMGEEDLDSRSDMYAVGLVLYESIAKRKVFEAENVMELMNKQMVKAHVPIQKINSKVSDNCSGLIDRLLSKKREGRFDSWEDLLGAMRNVLADKPVKPLKEENSQEDVVTPSSVKSLKAAPESRRPVQEEKKPNFTIVIGALVALIVIALAILFMK